MLKKTYSIIMMVLLLSACAMTPEQKETRRLRQAEELHQLQIYLASLCDKDAASLIAQQKGMQTKSEEEKKEFEQAYKKTVQNPIFQSCYQLAMKTYSQERRLDELERRQHLRDWQYFNFVSPPMIIYQPVYIEKKVDILPSLREGDSYGG